MAGHLTWEMPDRIARLPRQRASQKEFAQALRPCRFTIGREQRLSGTGNKYSAPTKRSVRPSAGGKNGHS
jgi:IS30 family transposase